MFDGVGTVPPEVPADADMIECNGSSWYVDPGDEQEQVDQDGQGKYREEDGAVGNGSTENGHTAQNPWRTTKRVLLATVDNDSTVVYYIIHDGIVKPRQN